MNLRELDKKEDYTIVTADDILSKMRMGKKTVSEIRMGNQFIPVRILTADEINDIWSKSRIEAHKRGWNDTEQNYFVQKATLQIASITTNDNIPFLTDKLLSKLNVDEVTFLYNELIKFWDDFNPALEMITPERFRELVDALKKNKISWSDCSTPERKAIFTAFVALIQQPEPQTSQPVSSPGGSPAA